MIPATGVAQAAGTGGMSPDHREGKTLETIVGFAHGKYFEAASRGTLINACEQGTGVAPGTALGTTAFFSLYNPVDSQKRLAIKKVSIGYISGTLGAGTLYHSVNNSPTQAAPSGGTLLANQCCDIGGAGIGSVGAARVGSTVAQPVAFRPLCLLTAELASSANQIQKITDDVDGEIVLEPGTSYQLQAVAAAGSTPKLTVGVNWEEVPLT
jgi:hypothetical protein